MLDVAIFVVCVLFTLTIPLNIWAKIRHDEWCIKWDLEQAERNRQKQLKEIREIIRKEVHKNE